LVYVTARPSLLLPVLRVALLLLLLLLLALPLPA
jgi:hypothetical protein